MARDPLDMSTLGAAASVADDPGRRPVVRLTVLGHPSARRVGEVSALPGLGRIGSAVEVSRGEPVFSGPSGSAPLTTPFASRRPVTLHRERSAIRVEPGELAGRVRVEGRPVGEACRVPLAELDRGVVLRLGTHVVLLLHQEPERSPSEPLGMTGASQALDALRDWIVALRRSDAPVLIRGETGSGKELVARALHERSARRSRPFVAVNMAAVPAELAASQLFGHVRGAFSGAHVSQDGLFVAADGGTLFLDEIGDAPDAVQAALLRVLECGEIMPVGSTRARRVDVRVVAATDADLESAVEQKRFRAPLYWRLAATGVDVPPLRGRRSDVGRLLVHFLRAALDGSGRASLLEPDPTDPRVWLSADVVERLALHDWPGNVRELRNVALALAAMGGPDEPLTAALVKPLLPVPSVAEPSPEPSAGPLRPRQVSPELLEQTLAAVDWRLGAAAARLGISRPSLNDLVDAHPTLKRAKFLTDEEIEAARERAVEAGVELWRALRVSDRALTRRLNGTDDG